MRKNNRLSYFLIQLFNELSDKKIDYCVCGNYEQLPYHTENDIDIWSPSTKSVIELIENIAHQQNLKLYLKNTNATGANIFLWYENNGSFNTIHIDVLKECRWIAILPLVRASEIKKNRETYNQFYVANKIVDTAMHLMYPLAQFGKITPKYYKDIKLVSKDPKFWKIISQGLGHTFAKKIKPYAENEEWGKIENAFKKNKLKLIWHSVCQSKYTDVISLCLFIFYNIKRLLKPSGLFIAFIGPDGCGKTTAQNQLMPFFKKGFTKSKIKKFYWRPFLLPRIKELITRQKVQDLDDHEPSARLALRKANKTQRTFHTIKLIYYWIDYILGRVKYQGIWSRGGIVCFDRYWEDLLIFPERFGLNISKRIVEILGIFVPKPDIIFYLHAEASILIGRKLELPINEIENQVSQYKKNALTRHNHLMINGAQSKEKVLQDIVRACLNKMSKRYEK